MNFSFGDFVSVVTALAALVVAMANRRKINADATQSEAGAVKTFSETAVTMGNTAEDYFTKLTALRDEFELYKSTNERGRDERTQRIAQLTTLLAQREEELSHLKRLIKLRDDRLEGVELNAMQLEEKLTTVQTQVEDLRITTQNKIPAITPEQIENNKKK